MWEVGNTRMENGAIDERSPEENRNQPNADTPDGQEAKVLQCDTQAAAERGALLVHKSIPGRIRNMMPYKTKS